MPKLNPETEIARALRLIKTNSEDDFNQSETARKLGVTPSAVCQRLKRPAVKKALQQIIESNMKKAGITSQKVYTKLNGQLDATRVISAVVSPDGKDKDATGQTCDFVEVPDNTAVDKAIDKCLTLMGHIKQVNGNGNHIAIINYVYGFRRKDASIAGN